MTASTDPATMSVVKRALLAVEEMQGRLDASDRARSEPIAVVGMGCRFPGGVNSPDAYWRLLERGVDAISEVPRDRWNVGDYFHPDPATPGKMNTRWGGFLDSVDRFDAAFFGISPREAARMDPQQRLLLEVAWEAIEDAGQSRERLAGRRAATFVGVCSSDYSWLSFADPERIDAYTGTGTSFSILAGRLGYLLDLRGPSLAIDTACSSSLVAVHLACQALRGRECDLALAGGVNVILSPAATVLASQMRMMAADGRCKTFDARADGFVRGEGCGVVVLRRLSDAQADRDRLYAVVRGSAVNGDGRTVGLTAPNGRSQEDVIRRALESGGIDPAAVGYVEAHGTATPLGDPIEMEALAAVLGGRQGKRRCAVGSVKTNFGHLEAASGIAGFMKAVLAVDRGAIPPHLHFRDLNPHISLGGTPFFIPTTPCPWPEGPGPRVAGVSSFGWSGTNSHVVIEQGPSGPLPPTDDRGLRLVPLSAHTPEALRVWARAWRDALLSGDGPALADLSFTACRRSQLDHRLAVAGSSREELAETLDAFLSGEPRPGLATGVCLPDHSRRVAFVFPGQGGQWLGMARDLLSGDAVFREAIERCARAFAPHVDWSLLEALSGPPIERIDVVQPVLFAVQIGLAAAWRSMGIEPAAVVGHSMGEVAAAYVAGALGIEEAARVICRRSRLLCRVRGRGAMAVVNLPVDEARREIGPEADRVSVAAANGPADTVLSGDPDAISAILGRLEARGLFCRLVKVDVASHSPQVDAIRDDLLAELVGLAPRAAQIPIYSTVTGLPCDGAELDAGYWARNLRETVLFAPAVERMVADGHDVMVELSPHPTLTHAAQQLLRDGVAIPSLRRDEPGRACLLAGLGALWAAGVRVDLSRLHPGGGRRVSLPPYPWQRERFWLPEAAPRAAREAEAHPLLGHAVSLAHTAGGFLWQSELDLARTPYLDDHRVQGVAILPGAGYLEMAMAAARALGPGPHVLENVEFLKLLFVPQGGGRVVQTSLLPAGEGGFDFRVHSRPGADGGEWTLHARAVVRAAAETSAGATLDELRARCPEVVPREKFYAQFAERGNEWGPRFQGIARLFRGEREAFAELRAPDAIQAELAAYCVHPALLDTCLQVLGAAVPIEAAGGAGSFVPVGVERVVVHGSATGGRLVSHARLRPGEQRAGDFAGDVCLMDEVGKVLVELTGVRGRGLDLDAAGGVPDQIDDWLYALDWVPSAGTRTSAGAAGGWLVLADGGALAQALVPLLEAKGATCAAAPGSDIPAALARAPKPLRGIVHLLGLEAPDQERASAAEMAAAQDRTCGSVAQIVRVLAGAGSSARLWIVTRGAQHVAEDGPIAVAQAPLWGLGRTLAVEHPALWGGLVDLDPAASAAECAAWLRDELIRGDDEDQVAWRRGCRYVPRLVHRPPGRPDPAAALRADATYLVTGGLGGLGLVVARWMVDRGARHLVLAGRTGLKPEQAAAVRELEARGADVRAVALDVADEEAVASFLAGRRAEGAPPVRGVVHAAGVAELRPLQETETSSLQATLRPKVAGAWALHRQLGDAPLDFFVLFSSMSAVLASPLLASYAAANAFLDALAHRRRAQGRPATSVAWGFWDEVGMAVRLAEQAGRSSPAAGMGMIKPAQGIRALERVIGGDAANVGVMPIHWWRWRRYHPSAASLPLLERVAGGTARARAGGEAGLCVEELLAAPVDERARQVEAYLRGHVARVLRLPEGRLDLHRPLNQLGLDSLMAVELKNRIERELGVAIPMVRILEGPSVARLAAVLLDRLVAVGSVRAPAEGRMPTLTPDLAGRHDPFPLNDIQQAYWLGRTDLFELGGVGAHMYVEVEGRDLDLGRLERAWQQLVERHDMLRAIVQPDGQQRVLAEVPPYRIAVQDLRGLDPPAAAARIEAVRDEHSHQVFATDRWPLFEIGASRLDDRRTRLHLSFDILIADVWSWQILFREWSRLYAAPDAALPELQITFRDYVLAEARMSGSGAYERSLAYWRGRLSDLPPAPDLPLARNPAEIGRPRFTRRTSTLEAERWSRLKERAARAGLTPSGVLLAAFADVLAVWAASPRFTINVTLFNRLPLHPQVNEIVGDFTSVNLLAVEAAAGGSFETRAVRIQKQLWQDLEHSLVSGVSLLRDLTRRQGGIPRAAMPIVFTSTLSGAYVRDAQGFPLDWLGELRYGISQTPQVWLDHQVFESRGALLFNWDAVEALFPPGLLDDMFAAYGTHLRRLADDEASFSRVERELVPARHLAWQAQANATDGPRSGAVLHSLFEARAERQPERTAVVSGGTRLTYGALRRRARAVAWQLREMGVRPGDHVAVVMEKGWEQVVGVLGVLEAGAAYLPVSPSSPRERLHYMLENGQARVIVTQPAVDARVEWPAGIPRWRVEGDVPAESPPLDPVRRPEDLAYVIYTSGSTGLPKGVLIDHCGAVNTILDVNERFRVGPDDRVLALSSLSFDLSVYDIFGTLAAGGTIVMPDAARARDPAHWAELALREGVTIWNSVPALLQTFIETASATPDRAPRTLRLALLSGDWIPVSLPDAVRALVPGVEVISLGGATEGSIWSILYPIGTVEPGWTSIPYGQPMRNQRFHVLDSAMEPRPVGVPGGLYIGGIGVALGYWRDEEKTRQGFLVHPRTGERLYRTGDLGRWMADGEIEFLGREDFQVKVRGHRVELGEIEAALEGHPGLRAAVAGAVGDPRGTRRLVAWFVPREAEAPMRVDEAPWRAAVAAGRAEAEKWPPANPRIPQLLANFDRLTVRCVCRALRRLHAYGRPGEAHTPAELLKRCGVLPRYEKWLRRCLAMLSEDGLLRLEGERFVAPEALPDDVPEALWDGIRGDVGEAHATLVRAAGDHLAEVIAGDLHAVQFLFPEGGAARAEDLYGESFRLCNLVARASVEAVLPAWPAHRPIRVVEIGAGVGSTTEFLLPVFPPERTTYHYTDVSRYFLHHGEKRFARYPFLRYALLDIERDPQAQGFERQGADLVVAASVLHATRSIAETLRHMRALLAPDGLALLVEETRFHRVFNLSMGLQQGFDRFEDLEVRRMQPLLSADEWRRELRAHGFAGVETLGPPGSDAAALGLEVILARAEPRGAVVDGTALRRFLEEKLPDYMVPSSFVMMDELPLSSTGKVDRKALPPPDARGAAPARAFTAPRTPTERTLAGTWSEVLQVERVGIDDDFFEVGGDSLLMVRAVGLLRTRLGRDIPLADVVRHRTIRTLAGHLEGEGPS